MPQPNDANKVQFHVISLSEAKRRTRRVDVETIIPIMTSIKAPPWRPAMARLQKEVSASVLLS
jgi:hypothetical protein